MTNTLYKRVGITLKKGLEYSSDVQIVVDVLHTLPVQVFFDERHELQGEQTFSHISEVDVLLVIGGDGSIIRAVRDIADTLTPIISINKGTVGFLAEVNMQDVQTELPLLLSGNGVIEKRSLLTVQVHNQHELVFEADCLNEAVVAQGKIARLLDMTAKIDGEFLAQYHADGLIIATPTGSTAYNISAGGPIVHPKLAALLITPINPHSLSQKPVVVTDSSVITLQPHIDDDCHNDEEIYLTLDGQMSVPIDPGSLITLTTTNSIQFVRRTQDTFFHALRTRLKWGERLED